MFLSLVNEIGKRPHSCMFTWVICRRYALLWGLTVGRVGVGNCPYSHNTHRKTQDMKPKNSPEYIRTLARWRELTQAFDERGLTAQEGRELRQLHAQLDAVERSSIAALTDDYAETMLREAGHIGVVEW